MATMKARKMTYCSTRGGDKNTPFERVLLSAYASDGGLYVPEHLPCFTKKQLLLWSAMSFPEVCAEVLNLFVDLPLDVLREVTQEAFKGFNPCHPGKPLPLRKVGGVTLLDTSLGPTLAFKDIGQQVVAQLLNRYLGQSGRHANILVETTGDTGPAAISGVQGCPHVDIFCMYPSGRVSEIQELQMISVDAPNVQVFRTEGDTDDQARTLKAIFMDTDFVREHNICSINSINWARIAAQSTYYVWAYLQMSPDVTEEVTFFVPTGAFGNSMGGFLASMMGLPIRRIVCATNENDVVHRTLSKGDFTMGENKPTVSPAMDIQLAYNMERMLYYICNCNGAEVARYMQAVEDPARRGMQLDPLLLPRIQRMFSSCSVSNEETLATMREVHRAHGFTLCPHSACAAFAARTNVGSGSDDDKEVVVLTAHPAKFEEAVIQATGSRDFLGQTAESSRFVASQIAAMRLKDPRFTWLRREGTGWESRWVKTLKDAVRSKAASLVRARL